MYDCVCMIVCVYDCVCVYVYVLSVCSVVYIQVIKGTIRRLTRNCTLAYKSLLPCPVCLVLSLANSMCRSTRSLRLNERVSRQRSRSREEQWTDSGRGLCNDQSDPTWSRIES